MLRNSVIVEAWISLVPSRVSIGSSSVPDNFPTLENMLVEEVSAAELARLTPVLQKCLAYLDVNVQNRDQFYYAAFIVRGENILLVFDRNSGTYRRHRDRNIDYRIESGWILQIADLDTDDQALDTSDSCCCCSVNGVVAYTSCCRGFRNRSVCETCQDKTNFHDLMSKLCPKCLQVVARRYVATPNYDNQKYLLYAA